MKTSILITVISLLDLYTFDRQQDQLEADVVPSHKQGLKTVVVVIVCHVMVDSPGDGLLYQDGSETKEMRRV